MSLNMQFIKNNSRKVYEVILRYTHCTFSELQKLCNLADIDICLALVQLIREQKIEQVCEKQGVYYRLPVMA